MAHAAVVCPTPEFARELEAGRELKRVREGVMRAAEARAAEQKANGEDPADKKTWKMKPGGPASI